MASRKKNVPSAQLGLGVLASTPSTGPALRNSPNPQPQGPDVDARTPRPSRDPSLPSRSAETIAPPIVDSAASVPADLDLESFDDYDDAATVDNVPRLRLLDPPQSAPTVIVEMVGEVFEVSRLRDNGTTVACVMWTRKELEELRRRIDAALEM